ncbi:MAG: zinc-ribbon domain containing protein [Vampirovibrionales bacterium]|nr:zinc-ribbon domain containing protein [Vampirovibrionales bacterium]
MPTSEIVCAACGTSFPFTEEEQEFYQSKGFQPPRKCKPCRDAAKASRGGGGGYGGGGGRGGYGGGGGGGYGRPQRQMYDAVCSACGVNTQVPFQPNGSKPVYCRECYQSSSSY